MPREVASHLLRRNARGSVTPGRYGPLVGADDWDHELLPPAPLPRTYWVTPSLLAGAYPGAVIAHDAEDKVRALGGSD
jgi:hypothetical protein